jgi:hypothetical protein
VQGSSRAARLSFFVVLWIVASCHRPAQSLPGVAVEYEISPQPVTTGPATVTVKLADAAGRPISAAEVSVEGDMAHAGMSPVFADARELPGGRYRAALNFAMAGDWVVILHVKLPGGQTLERQIDVKGVRAK